MYMHIRGPHFMACDMFLRSVTHMKWPYMVMFLLHIHNTPTIQCERMFYRYIMAVQGFIIQATYASR